MTGPGWHVRKHEASVSARRRTDRAPDHRDRGALRGRGSAGVGTGQDATGDDPRRGVLRGDQRGDEAEQQAPRTAPHAAKLRAGPGANPPASLDQMRVETSIVFWRISSTLMLDGRPPRDRFETVPAVEITVPRFVCSM